MRSTQILVRSGLTIAAAAAALPLALAAPAAAGPGLTVTATGTTVRATTTECANGGIASLMSPSAASFAAGRQTSLINGSASWTNVTTGTHSVLVRCDDGSVVGPSTVRVGSTPTISSTAPALGVRGGIGGGSEDYSTLTLVGGGVLVAAAAVGGGAWYLRRRGAPPRP
ncbi:hypothetical protein OG453_21170 [Streptomyces sp. NBC_01381]|uniref:hypothetical protein n=1 Tax=Streptomyces sp. NBC_01381 TaxID=2903845 RepID=UPI002253D94C|nr:hypothetical protein [Streptomyces sp. NBC_01381]MCX4669152.1 hypothetical protein [Streptomyces sp. NBC_01381]